MCVSVVLSSQIPSCLMPCKPSSNLLITESSLHHTVTHSIDSLHLSSKLNGIRGELKVVVRTKSKYYSCLVEVKDLQVDEVYDYINKKPNISFDASDTIISIKFRGLPKVTVRLQSNSNLDEFALLEKVDSLQNQLLTVENSLKNLESRFETTESTLQTTNYKAHMRAKLKYAISNARVTGHTLKCNHPNPIKAPSGDRNCYVQTGNWMYFHLQEAFTINFIRFRLWNIDHRVHTYNLGISNDGWNWRTLAANKAGTLIEEFKLAEPLEVRYLRFSGYNTVNRYIGVVFATIDWI